MRKLLLLSLTIIALTSSGQTSMSFYHFGDMSTFQNSGINPAHTPDARVFFGLPAISGVHAHFNNKFSYNELIREENNTKVISVGGIISELQRQNLLSTQVGVSLFHLGYSMPDGPVISLFANERIEGDFLYPKSLMEFVWEGSGPTLGNEIDLGAMGISFTHFREIGLGIAHQVNRQLRVGGRFKMLQGFSNASTPHNMKASIEVDPQTYEWNFQASDVILRTAGRNSYENTSHLTSPGNGGMAIDLGLEFMVNRYLGFSASVTDIGWINWKNDIESFQYQDETFSYDGVDIRDIDDMTKALQDSLFDRFTTTEVSDAYKTWLPTKAYGSIIWKYNDRTDFLGSVGVRYIHGQMKMLYGGGIRHRMGPFTATINAVKLPQQFFNIGAGLMVRGGPVQYYLAVDQALNFSVSDMKAIDVRTGVNFLIGRRAAPGFSGRGGVTTIGNNKNKRGKSKGVSTHSFLGSKVKTKRREGIYSIIKKQKRRTVPNSIRPPKIKGRKKQVKASSPSKQKIPSKTRRTLSPKKS